MNNTTINPEAVAGGIRLVAQHRNARQPTRALNEVITVLGSGDGCDLILASSKVDAAHAAIVQLNGGSYLCDLGAPGGTTLNSRRIRWARLAHGDIASVGPFSFRVDTAANSRTNITQQPNFSLRNDRSIGVVKSVDPVLVIGSDPGCDVVLSDASVAPRQALVAWTQRGPMVRDLLGRQAVRRNGERVASALLEHGDCIGVGRFELIFESLWDAAADRIADAPDSGQTTQGISDDEAVSILTNMPGMSESAPTPNSLTDSLAIPLVHAASPGASRLAGREPVWTAGSEVTAAAESADVTRNDWKERMVAAQHALDERARKMWGEIHAERERLSAYQEELQQKSRELLNAAKQKHVELTQREKELERAPGGSQSASPPAMAAPQSPPTIVTTEVRADGATTPESHNTEADAVEPTACQTAPSTGDDASTVERVFGGMFEPEAATLRNAEETARLASMLATEGLETPDADIRLAQQAADLAELVRGERGEMESAEARLESLRFEIERVQAALSRGKERHRMQESQLEARLQTVRATQATLRREREELAARIRQLDAKDAALKARIEEANRVRRELDREAKQLTRTQEEYDDKRRDLRLSLESERHRLRVRQAELQKQAAQLVKAAKEKRRLIEDEVSRKQAEIEQREVELRSRRTALEDAGRAKLERTAAELEQVVAVRLNDIESEVSRRQTELDRRMEDLLAGSTATGSGAEISPLEASLEEIAGIARLEEITRNCETHRLNDLQNEVEALRRAVGVTAVDAASAHDGPGDGQLAALSNRRNQMQREQRWASILRAKLNEKVSTLRGAEAVVDERAADVVEPVAGNVGEQTTSYPGTAP